MSYWILHDNFVQNRSVLQCERDCITDGTLHGVMIVNAEDIILEAAYFGAKFIDTGVRSIFVRTGDVPFGKYRKSNVKRDALALCG